MAAGVAGKSGLREANDARAGGGSRRGAGQPHPFRRWDRLAGGGSGASALAGEAWRARCGGHVAGWLEALAELEALASIGAYRYEHPEDPFPELDDGATGPVFDATGLGLPD